MKVMTFNIRYPETADGPNAWELRRDLLAQTIRAAEPDVAGLQEPVHGQLAFLDAALPGYARTGVSRYGNNEEKFTAILYRRSTLSLLDQGAFWLSRTPDVPGSIDWRMHKPYVVNWGCFHHAPANRAFHLFNAHFPYLPHEKEARRHSAILLAERASRVGGPVLLTGDFNAPAGAEVHQILTRSFHDAWRAAARRDGPEGTFHAFTGCPANRIDWLLYRGLAAPDSCRTVVDSRGGRYPSDHFPVLAEFP